MEEGPPCYKQLNADQSWVPNQWIFNIPRAYNDQVLNGTAHAEDLESEAGCPQADNTFLYGLFIVAGIVSVLLSAVVGWSFWYAVAGAGLIYTGVYGLIDHAARDSQNIWDSRWNYDWPDDWFGSRSGEFHYG